MAMRMILSRGGPGVGKTTVARELLHVAAGGDVLVQLLTYSGSRTPWRSSAEPLIFRYQWAGDDSFPAGTWRRGGTGSEISARSG